MSRDGNAFCDVHGVVSDSDVLVHLTQCAGPMLSPEGVAAALPLASETDAGLRRLAALTDTARPTRWDRIVAWVKAHPRSR